MFICSNQMVYFIYTSFIFCFQCWVLGSDEIFVKFISLPDALDDFFIDPRLPSHVSLPFLFDNFLIVVCF